MLSWKGDGMSSLISGRVHIIIKDCKEAILKGDKCTEELVKSLNKTWNDLESVLQVVEYKDPASTEFVAKYSEVSGRGVILMEEGSIFWFWEGGKRSINVDIHDDLGYYLSDNKFEFYAGQ
jgi:hypothetical protein